MADEKLNFAMLEIHKNRIIRILALMNCESKIYHQNGRYLIEFLTGFERVHAEVDWKGKCKIWVTEW